MGRHDIYLGVDSPTYFDLQFLSSAPSYAPILGFVQLAPSSSKLDPHTGFGPEELVPLWMPKGTFMQCSVDFWCQMLILMPFIHLPDLVWVVALL